MPLKRIVLEKGCFASQATATVLTLLFLCITLASPAHAISERQLGKRTAERIAKDVATTSTDFDTSVNYAATQVRVSISGPYSPRYLLRAWVAKNGVGTPTVQLYITIKYNRSRLGGRARFAKASDRKAKSFDLVKIKTESELSGYGSNRYTEVTEIVGLTLPMSYLTQHLDTGMDFRIESRTEEDFTIKVPPHYIRGMLMRIAPEALESTTATAQSDTGESSASVSCKIGENPAISISAEQCSTVGGVVIN